jgi:phenylalanyl-tRNA synthetase alpha chain
VRAMREYGAPLRAVFPGRCFRYEETDASHEHTFHQVEGLMIDRDLSVANLVSAMTTLLREIFEREVKVRLRPGFFPFVEPGFELDVNCLNCGGKGCPVCKQSGWLELLPCGMVHPAVIRAGRLDPAEWNGWAFGLGLSRLVLMKYEIQDIRLLASGDLRFLGQFRGAWR